VQVGPENTDDSGLDRLGDLLDEALAVDSRGDIKESAAATSAAASPLQQNDEVDPVLCT